MRKFLTPDEAAEYLRIGGTKSSQYLALLKLRRNGLPFYKMSKERQARILYTQDDLDAWMEERRLIEVTKYPDRGGYFGRTKKKNDSK